MQLIRLPRTEVTFPSNNPHAIVRKGTKDREWLPVVGAKGYIVISQNISMLESEEEVRLIVENNVGIVFVAGGEDRPHKVLQVLLNRWEDLEQIELNLPRPFCRMLSLAGRLTKYDLTQGPVPRSTARRLFSG